MACGCEDAVESFLRRGYWIVPSGVGAEVNQAIHAAGERIADEGPYAAAEIGDGILEAIPRLREVLNAPPIQQAVRAILGDAPLLHGHRHLHLSTHLEQMWHKDSYWGFRRIRQHRPRSCMLLYYPQDTTMEMGPTHVLAGSQYWTNDTEEFDRGEDILVPDDGSIGMFVRGTKEERHAKLRQAEEGLAHPRFRHLLEPVALTVPAGSCVLMHYDLFHRAGVRLPAEGDQTGGTGDWPLRCMFKFQYLRTLEPAPMVVPPREGAGTNGLDRASFPPLADEVDVVLQDIRSWMQGLWPLERQARASPSAEGSSAPPSPVGGGGAPPGDGDSEARGGAEVAEVPGTSASEVERVAAAYRLGLRGGAPAVSALIRALHGEEAKARAAAYGLAAAGPEATPSLLPLLRSDAPRVRSLSAFALGESARPSEELLEHFAAALGAETSGLVEAHMLNALVSIASRARALEEHSLCRRTVELAMPYLRPSSNYFNGRGENACLVALMAGGRDGDVGHEAAAALTEIWEKSVDAYMCCFAAEALRRRRRARPENLWEAAPDGADACAEEDLSYCDGIGGRDTGRKADDDSAPPTPPTSASAEFGEEQPMCPEDTSRWRCRGTG